VSGIHAEYAPSSMALTVACPGWRRQASLLPPEPETEQQRDGYAAHWVAALAAADPEREQWMSLRGQPAPNGVEITDEMLDGAAIWRDALEGFLARLEQPIQITRIHSTKCWGTPDAWQYNPVTRTVRIADYKFGHAFVDEFENWQLLAYAVGIADDLEIFDHTGITYEMTVVQPRYYNGEPVRTWVIQTAGLFHYAERMREAVRQAESENPTVRSGAHCTYCPARVSCHVLQKTIMNAVDFAGRADPMLRDAADIGRELKLVKEFIKRLEARETGLTAQAEALLRAGQRVPYFALESTAGRLAWTASVDEVEMLARMQGKSALKPPELITPKQAVDRKILPDTLVREYASRPTGAVKLVPESNKTARKFTA
jgi:hypothetical protein